MKGFETLKLFITHVICMRYGTFYIFIILSKQNINIPKIKTQNHVHVGIYNR